MLSFLSANLSTLIVGGIVAALFLGVCWKMYRDHRSGKHSCSCGGSCSCCPNGSLCGGTKPKTPPRS